MNKKRIRELMPVMMACLYGKIVQRLVDGQWVDDDNPIFGPFGEWRVKPTTSEPRDFWLVKYSDLTPTVVCKTRDNALEKFYSNPESTELLHVVVVDQ